MVIRQRSRTVAEQFDYHVAWCSCRRCNGVMPMDGRQTLAWLSIIAGAAVVLVALYCL